MDKEDWTFIKYMYWGFVISFSLTSTIQITYDSEMSFLISILFGIMGALVGLIAALIVYY